MKVIFWLVISISYFTLSFVSFWYNRKLDKVYNKMKANFQKEGQRKYATFDLIQKYTTSSTIVSFVGGILASLAALLSALF